METQPEQESLTAQQRDTATDVGNSCSNGCGKCILDNDHILMNNLDPVHQKSIAKALLREAAKQWQENEQFRRKTILMNDVTLRCDGFIINIDWLENGVERLPDGRLQENPECEVTCGFSHHSPADSMEWALDYIFGRDLNLHTSHRWDILTYHGYGGKPGSQKSMSRKAIADAHNQCLSMSKSLDVDAMCRIIDDIRELDYMKEHLEYKSWSGQSHVF